MVLVIFRFFSDFYIENYEHETVLFNKFHSFETFVSFKQFGSEAAVFFETVKRLDVDWQLLQTAILSVELFQAQVPYHDMLTEELANTLDDWFDLMGEFNLQAGLK